MPSYERFLKEEILGILPEELLVPLNKARILDSWAKYNPTTQEEYFAIVTSYAEIWEKVYNWVKENLKHENMPFVIAYPGDIVVSKTTERIV